MANSATSQQQSAVQNANFLFPTIISKLPPNRAKKKAEFHLKLCVKCQNLTEKAASRNPPETGIPKHDKNFHAQSLSAFWRKKTKTVQNLRNFCQIAQKHRKTVFVTQPFAKFAAKCFERSLAQQGVLKC